MTVNRGNVEERSGGVSPEQWLGLRAVAFDAGARDYLSSLPRGVGGGRGRGPAEQLLATRADRCHRGFDLVLGHRVDASRGVSITAEGLMHVEPDDALGLIRDCATRFRYLTPATSRALDRFGPLRRIRPSITLLEFG